MHDRKHIVNYLNSCSISEPSNGAKGTGLKSVSNRILGTSSNAKAADIMEPLASFYSEPKNITGLFNELSECERDFVSYIVQYGGNEHTPKTLELAKKHGIELDYEVRHRDGTTHKRNILRDCEYRQLKFLFVLAVKFPKTKVVAFFPKGTEMPSFVLETLKTVVEPMKFDYEEYEVSDKDFLVCREGRLSDYAALVRVAGSEKLKVKKDTFELTKAKLARLSELIGYDEVCDSRGEFCMPRDAEKITDFKIGLPFFTLAANSGLVDIDESGNVKPSSRAPALLSKSGGELAKLLFDYYMKSDDIQDIRYIANISTNDYVHSIKWSECRMPIIGLLKGCPGNKFVKFSDFSKYAMVLCRNFFKRLFRYDVYVKGSYYRSWGGYNPGWAECEEQVLRLILSFLCAIGMVDVAYTENVSLMDDDDEDFCVGIAGFRINKLGMWILGMADAYVDSHVAEYQIEEGSLTVLPDYTVVISGLKCRIEHETYLSQFLTKVSIDGNAAVYKIDFPSMVKAHRMGLLPSAVGKYLKKSTSRPMPENVGRSLADWEGKVGRVSIRTVTVLEAGDALLLEELKSIKGMGDILNGELKHAVPIDGSKAKRAKVLVEKNGWLVNISV